MKTNALLFTFIMTFTALNLLFGQGYDTICRTVEIAPNCYMLETYTSDSCMLSSYLYTGDSLITAPVTSSSFTSYEPFGDDVLNSNIWIPDADRGCLPYDVCYNPTDEKYYLYGGRKILIVDAETNTVIQDHIVSDAADNNQLFFITIEGYENRLVYVESSDRIFCATDDGKLVVIDGETDTKLPDNGSAVQYFDMLHASLHYNPTIDRLFRTLCYYDKENLMVKSFIDVYDEDGVFIYQFNIDNKLITDISTNSAGTRVYLTLAVSAAGSGYLDNGQVKTYGYANDEMQEIQSSNCNYIPQTIVSIPANESHGQLFCVGFLFDENQHISIFNGYNGEYITWVTVPYFLATYQGGYNAENDKVYYTGVNDVEIYGFPYLEGGIVIIDDTPEVVEYYALEDLFATGSYVSLLVNSDYIYAGTLDKLTIIDPGSDDILGQSKLAGAQSRQLTLNDTKGVLSANTIDGSCTLVDVTEAETPYLDKYFQAGSASWSGCFNTKNDKVYFIQNGNDDFIFSTFNDSSFIAIIDGATNQNIKFLTVGDNLKSCAYDPVSNKIFVTSQNEDKIVVIDGETDEIVDEITQGIRDPGDIYPLPHSKIACTAANPVASHTCVDIINTNSYSVSNINIPGPVTCFAFDGDHILYLGYGQPSLGGDIVALDLNNLDLSDPIGVSVFPGALAYDATDNVLYCINYEETPILCRIRVSGWNNYYVQYIYFQYDNLLRYMEFRQVDNERKLYILGGSYFTIYNIDENDITQYYIDVRSILYNPYNDRLYMQLDYLNDDPTCKMLVLDCKTDQICSLVDLDQRLNLVYASPYPGRGMRMVLNSTDNRVYCGNISLSNVSAIDCSDEVRTLQEGWNWLSFPRLDRDNQTNDPVDAIDFLENVDPFPSYLLIEHWIAYPPYMTDLEYNTLYGWQSNYLDDIYSDRGYKMETDNTGESILPCPGTVLRPDWEIDLYGPNKDNWIGYFLTEPSWAQDAFAEVWSKMTLIQTQYWAMVKIGGIWYQTPKVTPLKYGDMVNVRCTEDCSFQWNGSAFHMMAQSYEKTSYFTYEEKADYIPIFVELDPEDMPLEVGVFSDTVCYGAETVLPGDTMVQINAYLDTTGQGEYLDFEFYYGTKSAPVGKKDYLVLNPVTGRQEPGKITTGDHRDWYVVSFKKEDAGKQILLEETIIDRLSVQPNPFNNRTEIDYVLNKDTYLAIRILDAQGVEIRHLVEGSYRSGNYTFYWDGRDDTGNLTKEGLYMIVVETPEDVKTLKVIRL